MKPCQKDRSKKSFILKSHSFMSCRVLMEHVGLSFLLNAFVELSLTVFCYDIRLVNLLNEGLSTLSKVPVTRGSITSMVKHPNGTHIIIASSDMQVKMIQVHNLATTFSYSIPNNASSMQFLLGDTIAVQGSRTIGIIKINLFGTYLSQLSSQVKQLWTITRKNKPWNILAISEEGLLRLMSPLTGKSLTSILPTSSLDELNDVAYCEVLGKLFILMANGDIWVVSTKTNPSTVIEVWKSGFGKYLSHHLLLAYWPA